MYMYKENVNQRPYPEAKEIIFPFTRVTLSPEDLKAAQQRRTEQPHLIKHAGSLRESLKKTDLIQQRTDRIIHSPNAKENERILAVSKEPRFVRTREALSQLADRIAGKTDDRKIEKKAA